LDRILSLIREKAYGFVDIVKNFFQLTMEIMFLVGGYPSLTGDQKKRIVIDVLKKLIDQEKTDEINTEDIQILLETLSIVIDTFFRVAKGEFCINEIASTCCICFLLGKRFIKKVSKKVDFEPA
jgi:hypothetical protein